MPLRKWASSIVGERDTCHFSKSSCEVEIAWDPFEAQENQFYLPPLQGGEVLRRATERSNGGAKMPESKEGPAGHIDLRLQGPLENRIEDINQLWLWEEGWQFSSETS